MLGAPKFQMGDKVKFVSLHQGEKIEREGVVGIVDRYGSFFQTQEPSYDIYVETEPLFSGTLCLWKHIPESDVEKI